LNKKVSFNKPYRTGRELEFIQDVLAGDHFSGNGKYTKLCQDYITSIVGAKKVLLTDSCTSALEMSALLLRDLSVSQEVIVPSYTFVSTAAAFARAGFKVVFADVVARTMMLDLNDVREKLTPQTTAIVAVHYGGSVLDLGPIRNTLQERNITIVEDAAQAFGCAIQGSYIGSSSDLVCFSFHETKNLHCGLGGALIINNDAFESRAEYIWERGTNRRDVSKGLVDKYSWVELGGSFYPTELQAAFLYAQLQNWRDNIRGREKIWSQYYAIIEGSRLFGDLHSQPLPNVVSNYHAFWIIFASELECNYVRQSMVEMNFSTVTHYVPLHTSKVGQELSRNQSHLGVTEQYWNRLLRLPLFVGLEVDDARLIAESVVSLVKNFRTSI